MNVLANVKHIDTRTREIVKICFEKSRFVSPSPSSLYIFLLYSLWYVDALNSVPTDQLLFSSN